MQITEYVATTRSYSTLARMDEIHGWIGLRMEKLDAVALSLNIIFQRFAQLTFSADTVFINIPRRYI